MTQADKTINVKAHERKLPQKPRDDKRSQISDPQDQRGEGVKIMSGKGTGPQGVQRLSRREPGELETRVELATDQNLRNTDGRRRFEA